jgi:hypothetical protein
MAGAEVERWTFTKPPPDIGYEHEVWSVVVFDEPTLADHVVRVFVYELLWQLAGAVEAVLQVFADRYFAHEGPWWARGATKVQ